MFPVHKMIKVHKNCHGGRNQEAEFLKERTLLKKLKMEFWNVATDFFYFLPDDLLLFIFSQVADLKTLLYCSLVSKRFASLISQTQSISAVVSSRDHKFRHDTVMFSVLFLLRQVRTFEEIPETYKSYIQEFKLPKFLDKFGDLEDIYIQYGDTRNTKVLSSFPNWKVKLSDSSMIDKLLCVSPASVCKQSGEIIEVYPRISKLEPIMHYTEWMCIISMLVKSHSSLRRVTIVDAKGRGKLFVQDEQLARLRNRVSEGEFVGYSTYFTHHGRIPIVQLPLSGVVMKDVTVVIYNMVTKFDASRKDDFYDEIISWDFGNDEKMLGESVKEIMKNRSLIHKFTY